MSKKVVVIGSGLGGLECGYILAKHGMQVTILEQGQQTGGCLQSFRRNNQLFDTGLHYVGGLDDGQPLRRIFDYFGLMNLPWRRMDHAFDEVVIGGKSYFYHQGHEEFARVLAEEFPEEKEGIEAFTRLLKEVGEHIWDGLQTNDPQETMSARLMGQSAWNWLESTIANPVLRQVLSGTSLKLHLDKERLPLYIFAQINNSFLQSAWRLDGGGQQIAAHLTDEIRKMGGEVHTHARVTQLIENEGYINQVEINGEKRIDADWVISNAHPKRTLALIKECSAIRKVYRKRIENLPNSFGMFTVNIKLQAKRIPYLNRNIYIHQMDADLWTQGEDVESVLVHFYPDAETEGFASAVDLLTPMRWSEVEAWKESRVGHREQEYESLKQAKAKECIRLVSSRLPELSSSIESYWTSSPLTYEQYTGTAEGSAYGIMKDWRSPMTSVLPCRTPIKNLLMTGQNLDLHGVLGTSMTALYTCAEILEKETIKKDFGI